jgi:hypothetical protein
MRYRSMAVVIAVAALAASTRANDPGPVEEFHPGETAPVVAAATQVHPPGHPWWMKRPCADEDSVNCYWNARLQGNGAGKSFYVRKVPHTSDKQGRPLVCIFYVNRHESRYDQCWRYEGGGL